MSHLYWTACTGTLYSYLPGKDKRETVMLTLGRQGQALRRADSEEDAQDADDPTTPTGRTPVRSNKRRCTTCLNDTPGRKEKNNITKVVASLPFTIGIRYIQVFMISIPPLFFLFLGGNFLPTLWEALLHEAHGDLLWYLCRQCPNPRLMLTSEPDLAGYDTLSLMSITLAQMCLRWA